MCYRIGAVVYYGSLAFVILFFVWGGFELMRMSPFFLPTVALVALVVFLMFCGGYYQVMKSDKRRGLR